MDSSLCVLNQCYSNYRNLWSIQFEWNVDDFMQVQ